MLTPVFYNIYYLRTMDLLMFIGLDIHLALQAFSPAGRGLMADRIAVNSGSRAVSAPGDCEVVDRLQPGAASRPQP
jgi:hypothetical protein